MVQDFLAHPTEETLELYALAHCEEQETELVETHLLMCENCRDQLDAVEQQIAVMKLALQAIESERIAKEQKAAARSWHNWFTMPRLSFAGAAAFAVLCGIAFVPASVQVTADRDRQIVTLPEWRPLHIALKTSDIPNGAVKLEVVNERGSSIWTGKGYVANEHIDISLPRMTQPDTYFLRLYNAGQPGQLLREVSFAVR